MIKNKAASGNYGASHYRGKISSYKHGMEHATMSNTSNFRIIAIEMAEKS